MDSRRDRGRSGFLPSVSAEQARRLFLAVEPWLAKGRQAALDPTYRVDLAAALPVNLPPWVEIEPCPVTHLQAMLESSLAIRARMHIALASLQHLPATAEHAKGYARLLQLVDQAAAAADYAQDMLGPGLSQQLHTEVEAKLKFALGRQHHIGQLCALPALLAGYLRPAPTPPTPPGGPWPTTYQPGYPPGHAQGCGHQHSHGDHGHDGDHGDHGNHH